jgi:signal transduction histidine kinase
MSRAGVAVILKDYFDKMRRGGGASIIALSVTLTFLFLLFFKFLPDMRNRLVQGGLDLSGEWEYCISPTLEKNALQEQSFSDCEWKGIELPRVSIREGLHNQYGFFVLRKHFQTPSFCTRLEDVCSFIIGEMVGAQRAILNGTFIGEHGKFDRKAQDREPYPAYFFISNSILKKEPHLNELKLLVYSPERVFSGMSRDPLAIVKNNVGITIVESLVAEIVILPLLTGLVLLVMATLSLMTVISKSYQTDNSVLKCYLLYCLAVGLFEVSLSRLPRSYFSYEFSCHIHFILRFYSDLCLLHLVSSYLKNKSLFFKLSKYLILSVVFLLFSIMIYKIYSCFFPVNKKTTVGLTYYIAVIGSPVFLLPIIECFFGTVKKWNDGAKYKMIFVLFMFVSIFQMLDILILAEFISGPFHVRFYPFFIGLIFGIEIFKDRAQEVRDLAVSSRLGELATQVAHDIRSPLAVLKVIEPDVRVLPEQTREYLQAAVNRIHDIASDLLATRKNRGQALGADGRGRDRSHNISRSFSIDMHQLLSDLVRLKKAEYRDRSELEMTVDTKRITGPVCIDFNPIDLNRVLSNLVNNSVEAKSKKIILDAWNEGALVAIQISDDGDGIPTSVLERLGEKGMSYDKEGGHGLGIFGAKSAIESVGGSLRIKSSVGEGTVVTLAVPLSMKKLIEV